MGRQECEGHDVVFRRESPGLPTERTGGHSSNDTGHRITAREACPFDIARTLRPRRFCYRSSLRNCCPPLTYTPSTTCDHLSGNGQKDASADHSRSGNLSRSETLLNFAVTA